MNRTKHVALVFAISYLYKPGSIIRISIWYPSAVAKARTKSASGGNTLRGRVQSVTNAVSHGWELICACDVVATFCCKLISLAGEEIKLSALSRHPLQVWIMNALGLCLSEGHLFSRNSHIKFLTVVSLPSTPKMQSRSPPCDMTMNTNALYALWFVAPNFCATFSNSWLVKSLRIITSKKSVLNRSWRLRSSSTAPGRFRSLFWKLTLFTMTHNPRGSLFIS